MTEDERKQSELAYAHRWEVLQEVNSERVRQDTKWGEQNHPDVNRGLTDGEGGWLVAHEDGVYTGIAPFEDLDEDLCTRWWALGPDGTPCAWPKAAR